MSLIVVIIDSLKEKKKMLKQSLSKSPSSNKWHDFNFTCNTHVRKALDVTFGRIALVLVEEVADVVARPHGLEELESPEGQLSGKFESGQFEEGDGRFFEDRIDDFLRE